MFRIQVRHRDVRWDNPSYVSYKSSMGTLFLDKEGLHFSEFKDLELQRLYRRAKFEWSDAEVSIIEFDARPYLEQESRRLHAELTRIGFLKSSENKRWS